MKKTILICLATLGLWACGGAKQSLSITVSNDADLVRTDEMVSLSMEEVASQLGLSDTAQLVVLDAHGGQVPYQVTYDDRLIFPVTVGAQSEAQYSIQIGVPEEVGVKVCGRVYPDRVDDLAWENDLVGFRAYGPGLQARGERGFGYDLFTKRATDEPVLEEMYAMFLDTVNHRTYHVDHGYGMDCYAVGPTLGAGVAALLEGDEIVFPWCYKDCEILDNGPLRFTAKLTFNPIVVGRDSSVVETRIITLDLGSHLNRTAVSYSNLTESRPICAGIVLHDTVGVVKAEAERGYIAYEDPTTGPNQGKIMVGCAFPAQIGKAYEAYYASEAERKAHGNAFGHVLAVTDYEPGSEFVYYWGFGWDRADVKDMEAWNEYMNQAAQKVRWPLKVKID